MLVPGRFAMHRSSTFVFASLALLLVACTSDAGDASPPRDDESTGGQSAACTTGETRCEGDLVATCADGVFAAPVACEGDALCKAGACTEPTDEQRAQAKELASMVSYVEENTAWHGTLDWTKLVDDGRREIFRGDGGDAAYFGALFHAFVKVPQGHQGLYLAKGCGTKVPMIGSSRRGVCGRPHPRGIVVTNARANNALGLAKGDLVVRVGTASGRALIDTLADRPACVSSRPGVSYRDTSTAATFADLVSPGEELEIESPSGERRTVTVSDGALPQAALSCADPLGRSVSVPVESYVRPDGIAVIRLPGFLDPEQPFPSSGSQTDYETYKATFEAKIQAAFDDVKSARAIVWDIRGNGGGLTQVGLDIASGFPGAQAGELSYCQARVPKTSPPKFDELHYAAYALAPGGSFAYAGKIAVVTEGMNYSAADYFPLAVKSKTSAILVGAATAGGFGATSDSKAFSGPPAFTVAVDLNRCALASDDSFLEGRGVEPHVAVDYDPADLAAGRDTVLERAVTEVDR